MEIFFECNEFLLRIVVVEENPHFHDERNYRFVADDGSGQFVFTEITHGLLLIDVAM